MTRLSLALFVLFSQVIAARGATMVSAPEAGFELVIPDVGWAHDEQRGRDGLETLAIGPAAEDGLVRLSIAVSFAPDSGRAAIASHVAELRASIAGDASITDIEDLEIEVAGRPGLGLHVVQEAFQRTFRVHVFFMRARGVQYRIQFHAPREAFDAQWPIARQVLDGFTLIELDEEGREHVRLRGLADRCGLQVDWARDWNDAARRARQTRRLIVVAVHAQPGFDLGDALNERVFMSPEVIALMEHRFVGWHWSAGQPAPFVHHDVFGLSGTTFGVGLLVCTPDGEVVRQIFVPQAALVADALRAVANVHPELAPPPARATATRVEQITFLIDSGQLDAAALELGEARPDEARDVAYQRARLHQDRRDGEAALAALAVARHADAAASNGAPTNARLWLEEAGVQVGLGRNDLAKHALERCMAATPGDSERARAMLLQGALALSDGKPAQTRVVWEALTRELPDEPAAWIAAAALLGPGLEMDAKPDLRWPDVAAQRVARLPAPAPSELPFETTTSLDAAIDWMIETQRDDGGWDIPFGRGDLHPAPSPILMASQAIGIRALARAADAGRDRDPARAAACVDAATRGLRRYLDDRETVRRHPRPIAFMDYTCWSASYGLFCLADLLDPAIGLGGVLDDDGRVELEVEAATLVDALVRIQAPNGGWSYYVSGEVNGTSPGAAMSFTTATVLLALQAAQARGLDVPDDVLARGIACLASLRDENGVFDYMRTGTGPYAAKDVDPAGAAARGPVCTLALQRAGRLGPDAMAPAFTTYVEHLDGFGAEARKALMHAGPAGQGSHYLLYDYATAAEALRHTGADELDPLVRGAARAAILEQLARCRNADGSFVDNPIIGCAPATGLAVVALIDLCEDPWADERSAE